MSYFDLYNRINKMSDVDEIKNVIKMEAIQELAGDEFVIKQKRVSNPKPTVTRKPKEKQPELTPDK